ncbi:hypothetical protein [Kitasatospora aureofaciens]|uniref:hypothetical protein n=1 Tax=Kitasatospora aureofaciens TaxID=1894 RepID=UPI0036F45205
MRVDAHHHVREWGRRPQSWLDEPEWLARVVSAAEELTAGLDPRERAQVLGGTAVRAHGLPEPASPAEGVAEAGFGVTPVVVGGFAPGRLNHEPLLVTEES